VDLRLDVPVLISGERPDDNWTKLDALFNMIADEYRAGAGASEKVLVGLVSVVLSVMGRLGGSSGFDTASPTVALGMALRRAIDQHYKEDWPVRRYVELLATTPHLLDKSAREVFGKTVKEMVLERRLLEAKRLLKFTIRPVEDIGRAIGFDDPAYFSRFFRKRTGEAPAAWRRRHLGTNA
jgi:AraC family transcriptional activator of pobA